MSASLNLYYPSRYDFPDPEAVDPEGLGYISGGGDLAPDTLIAAYARGLFPWFNEDHPIAWWSPDPRCILIPSEYKPSKSLRRQAKSSSWRWSVNHDFYAVINACRLPRRYSDETWIHDDMIEAYTQLHELGFAHSIEIWDGEEIVGGLYGLKIGQLYCGESMFHTQSNASKMAFWALNYLCVRTQVQMLDCQLVNEHLLSLGAISIPRTQFLQRSSKLVVNQSQSWSSYDDALYSVNSLFEDINQK